MADREPAETNGLMGDGILTAVNAHDTAAVVTVSVDRRVDLLSLVFRLAGTAPFNDPRTSCPDVDAIDQAFAPYAEDSAVHRARQVTAQYGIGFDAVPSLAVHTRPGYALELDLSGVGWPERLDPRWARADPRGFLALVEGFAARSDFDRIWAANASGHREVERRLQNLVDDYLDVTWFSEFVGVDATETFALHVGTLFSGNFGTAVAAPGQPMHVCPCIGSRDYDTSGIATFCPDRLPTVIHEFAHPFCNPVVDECWAVLQPASVSVLAAGTERMAALAYPTQRAVLYESLVRAVVVCYIRARQGEAAASVELEQQIEVGFSWLLPLVKALDYYGTNRARYPTLRSFGPVLARSFTSAEARP